MINSIDNNKIKILLTYSVETILLAKQKLDEV